FQTNAVLWRADRFDWLQNETWTWMSDARVGSESASCSNLAATGAIPAQIRTKNVAVPLWDKVAKKNVVVASIHWAREPKDTEDPENEPEQFFGEFFAHGCAKEN